MAEQYRISGTADHVYVEGAVKQSAKLNADGFFKALLTLPSHRCLDLLRIASGTYVVDRISKRKKRGHNEEGIRKLHLVFEVHDFVFWKQSEISESLTAVLSFLTDDDWSLDFEQMQRVPGDLGHQDFLDLPRPFHPRHAALYSGGLDSAVGLANRILQGANDFMLVTVGHQSGLHRRVREQLNGNERRRALDGLVFDSKGGPVRVMHSTLTTSLEGGKSRRMRQQEKTQRTRAFFFCAAAAIAAKAYGVEDIEMFENGVGAINLPLMTGMLGSGLTTRGAHPTFLRLMSELSTQVTESPIRFKLPFESSTKAEMMQQLRTPELAIWAQESRSCVHASLRQFGKTHCGRCAACIERRQAFAAAGIEERLDSYQTNALVEPLDTLDESDYLHLYQLDAAKWIERSPSVRRRMINHLRLTGIPPEQDEKIIELQVRHSHEVLRTFGPPFSRHYRPISISMPESTAMGSEVAP
ncbi:MAG: 7-cyano-7-deazaguanine synthase [Dokdonella sp.]